MQLNFPSQVKFLRWKEDLQKTTHSLFMQWTGLSKKGIVIFYCCRAGERPCQEKGLEDGVGNDHFSVDMAINKFTELGESNPIFYYHPRTAESDTFARGMQTTMQRRLLDEFGSNVMCIDVICLGATLSSTRLRRTTGRFKGLYLGVTYIIEL
uniref:Uncharacterized protein n=1 Tax=Plectus sambesii TaxID=2011161 RepID=A0A914XHR9_9BILA